MNVTVHISYRYHPQCIYTLYTYIHTYSVSTVFLYIHYYTTRLAISQTLQLQIKWCSLHQILHENFLQIVLNVLLPSTPYHIVNSNRTHQHGRVLPQQWF